MEDKKLNSEETASNKNFTKIVRFEDLQVWKEGMRLASDVYKHLTDCKDYGLRDQMQRSAVSVPSNIAEGFE